MKKFCFFVVSVAIATLHATPAALIGGFENGNTAYAAYVSSDGIITPFSLPGLTGDGLIQITAINAAGAGLIGGQDAVTSLAYAAWLSPAGVINQLTSTGFVGNGLIESVAINALGNGLIGGLNSGNLPYAATVSPSGVAAPLTSTGFVGNGQIDSVAINALGNGLIGGQNSGNLPYAAIVSQTGAATQLTLPNTSGSGYMYSVAINSLGQGLIGGQVNGGMDPYLAKVSSTGTVASLNLPGTQGTGVLYSVALNDSGQGLIGGVNNTSAPYAAIVSPSGTVTELLSTGFVGPGIILQTAINNSGNGLIVGTNNGTQAYAALVSSTGIALPLNIPNVLAPSGLFSVAINNLLVQIPTETLSGNSALFAQYINTYAQENAFYFIPSVFDGTLAEALVQAAPTRNGVSSYTASNNMFFLNNSLSYQLRKQSHSQRHGGHGGKEIAHSFSLIADAKEDSFEDPKEISLSEKKKSSFMLWFDAIAALAYQKAQSQTPAFNPSTGGIILALDGEINKNSHVGMGFSYLYTHVHETLGAGYSNINQESLFGYASWDNQTFYVDGALWEGLFQTSQVREIGLTGFHFVANSTPKGWQLVPHVETGYKRNVLDGKDFIGLLLNPFIMLDWANSWQGRYQETGRGPFNIEQTSQYSSLFRTEVGLRFYETCSFDSWFLTVQEKISYVNVHSSQAGLVNAFLIGSTGSFTVETLAQV